MQRQRIQEHLLAESAVPLKREYCDILTGTTPKRADYQAMLADAERGAFSHLALYRADRFGRNAMEGLQAATKLISAGIKIRVANMPSLCPETPDGFFMFMLQMGLAQREVEVLRERTADGMEAKIRAGGWAHKAPAGYLNKEVLVSSNKYHRWVEINPEYSLVIRLAWDLLLTRRYTLKQICNELDRQGYLRPNGRAWIQKDRPLNDTKSSRNLLSKIFHNPFYAGWGVSKRFGIAYGEVRGTWEPIVSSEEFERGLKILREHDQEKSRTKHQFYLLRGLLWLQSGSRLFRLYGSTPRGRHGGSYSYYLTHSKLDGSQLHIPCGKVNQQIGDWLLGVRIDSTLIPSLQKVYVQQIASTSKDDHEEKISRLQQRLRGLRDEELRLGRLLLMGKMGEDTYDKLRGEWQEKVRQAQFDLDDLERDTSHCLDDLELAMHLLSKLPELYERLDEQHRATLLQILAKRLLINVDGTIIDHQLHSPFTYLLSLQEDLINSGGHGSIDNQKEDASHFLALLRFEQRARLDELELEPSEKGL
jgi:DNA invertase Pin-like site-specific DNA recombinase